jgi:hypothetical protein
MSNGYRLFYWEKEQLDSWTVGQLAAGRGEAGKHGGMEAWKRGRTPKEFTVCRTKNNIGYSKENEKTEEWNSGILRALPSGQALEHWKFENEKICENLLLKSVKICEKQKK